MATCHRLSATCGAFIYPSDAVHPRHQANFRVFDPLAFLAEMSAHIPDAHEKTTLFYGGYSNRTRGCRKQHGLRAKGEVPDPLPGPVTRAPLEVRRSWARLMRQVYEVDPLRCPHCGGTRKVSAVVEPACADTADRRPAIIRQILEHLGLSTAAPSFRAPPDPPDGRGADPSRAWSDDLLVADLPVPDPVRA